MLMVEFDLAPKIGSSCALALAQLIGTQKSKLFVVIRHAQLLSATLEVKTLR